MNRCTFEGCDRKPAFPDQARCEVHRLRWVAGQPAERRPEWLRRRDEQGLPAKDYTGHAA